MDVISSCPNHFEYTNTNGSEESNKLELTLAPPGLQKWSTSTTTTFNHTTSHQHDDDSLLSLGHHQPSWCDTSAKFLQVQSTNDALHHCSMTRVKNDASVEKIGFLPSVSTVPQKRTAPGQVVGWPPIRSFRKNLASSSNTTKPSIEAESLNDKHGTKTTEQTTKALTKGLFVKINMDGIPIGRKVDLNSYDSYQKLSSAVDNLFRGLLAAQADSFAKGIPSNLEEGKSITGLMDGGGEYTLVYEDNEGDRVLVGDVPWRMFVSTVKRLRVLKTSELPSLSLGGALKMQTSSASP